MHYFLEDPYESIRREFAHRANGTHISLRVCLESPVSRQRQVYLHRTAIFGHNTNIKQLPPVTTGNDYCGRLVWCEAYSISPDNVSDPARKERRSRVQRDEVSGEADSRKHLFGGPTSESRSAWTLHVRREHFYDSNLSASGSASVTVNGNMTAGNKVSISSRLRQQHSKLTVNFDDRLVSGKLALAGIPTSVVRGQP